MRIAVTGTHGSGKTTLIEDFVAAHPAYEAVAEPYWRLAERGALFAAKPTTADFEAQLAESCRLILDEARGDNVIFDRSPLDFLAYLDITSADEGFEWLPQGRLLTRITRALETLDLILFIPLTEPDEIPHPIEHPTLRRRVDARLKALIRGDELG
ncbi:ATP-binding protein, partial [Mesorhizobium sp. BR1-1-16]|uniref:AAA family ATPase n=1 Tax=Mesorhizobium sp. BR1-1-16 TaxID=2876653 RepID=UPI001CCAF79B